MMSEKQIEYTCKILPLGNFVSLAIVLSISMSLMFIGTFTGLPVWLNVILLVGSMYFLLDYLSSYALFSISETNLTRNVLSDKSIFHKSKQKSYAWNNVLGFKNGTEKGKYRGEYQFLEIKFKNGDVWNATDMYGERRQDYTIFLNTFLEMVHIHNEKTKLQIPSQPSTMPINAGIPTEKSNHVITREKTFYETIYAKLFTIVLGIFIVSLLFNYSAYLNGSSIFKLIAVIIPGFIYLVYRSFIKKYR